LKSRVFINADQLIKLLLMIEASNEASLVNQLHIINLNFIPHSQ